MRRTEKVVLNALNIVTVSVLPVSMGGMILLTITALAEEELKETHLLDVVCPLLTFFLSCAIVISPHVTSSEERN